MALMSRSMDGTGSSRGNRNNNNSSNIPLGINRHSNKINKPLKRSGNGGAAALPLQQASKQPPPPPVYNINKNDFRNVVQRLTGSPLPERYDPPPPPILPAPAPAPPPQNPKPPNSRLHRIRPPPLRALNPSSGPPQPMLRSPQFMNSMSPFMSPLPPLTPNDAVWAGNVVMESPVSRYMKYLQDQDNMAGGGGGGGGGGFNQPSPQMRYGAPHPGLLPSPRRPPPPLPLPSPTSQFLLPSPLPSPGSFLNLPSPGLFPMNFFTQSPSGQFGFPGGAPSLPQSPLPSPGMMFSLQSPPGGSFRLPSPRWRDDRSFSFPDPDRRQ